ncbi:insulin-like growth factor-binding protein 1 [Salarias fasciatus]|uniref:Insulin-like growth factor-binding protein 1 n=1 Tax=Salarias fasciatus TaxID=181472 RepID=A0A672GI80_SALFA|nr:insulin-like growth factor-binding protein 1 [Salarias fasciatus]
MSDPDTQRLMRAPSQQTNVDVETPSARSGRAYKVAGITLLACVLIVGQAAIAYFLISQRGDIKSLQEKNDEIRVQMGRPRSAAVPVRMQMPINSLMTDLMDEESSSDGTKKEPVPLTTCQQERAGQKTLPVPGFYPKCDQNGLYKVEQCLNEECWCVKPLTGEQIPGTVTRGPASCGFTGVRAALPVLKAAE